MEGVFTLDGYRELKSSLFIKVFWNTIEISFLEIFATLLISYPIAYHLAKQPPRRRARLFLLVLLPFWTSTLVKAFAFTEVVGHDGLVNRLITMLPGIDHGIKMLYNRIGVMIGLTHYLIPFMVFPILTNLLAQDSSLVKAAKIMGAGPVRIFLRITLPLSMPGVMAGSLMTFILSLGIFVTPTILGGRKDYMLGNLIDLYTREILDWTYASAIAVVLFVMSLFFIFILSRIPGGKNLFGETGRL
jgi:ABC-type spermidine/putrescine transport system permease subunit I